MKRYPFNPAMLGLVAVACSAEPAPTSDAPSEVRAPEPTVAAYQVLDNVEGDHVNLNPTAIRPMLWVDDADGAPHVYAVNSYLSTVVHFDATQRAVQTFPTLSGPVAIARFTYQDDRDWLLVVCQNSDALAIHDFATGRIRHVVSLPGEPADVVVHADSARAFVSSMGTNTVVEIDLLDPNGPQVHYEIAARRPAFLSMSSDGEVFVAPMLSGNNSGVEHIVVAPDTDPRRGLNPQATTRGILDFDIDAATGLPDTDLFWIDTSSRQAIPVVTGAGTVMNAHGFHPNGELWALNVEHNNKDRSRQSEPAINGEISFNRLGIARLPALAPGVAPVTPRQVELDDTDLDIDGIQYDRARSVGMPYAIDFVSNGWALVAGLMSDNVTVLDNLGQPFAEWDLPDGCIPRQVLIDPSETFIVSYCSGLNTVHVNLAQDVTAPPIVLDLGYDPTPDDIRAGRIAFYDGANSRHNNASCATCHVEGGVDGLAWNLGKVPGSDPHLSEYDDKGPMTTQSLKSINVTAPFHWRGEQLNGLADFRGAFTGLLGGTDLSDDDFVDFERFILSLETPPNPRQNRRRLVDDRIQPPGALIGPGIDFPKSSAINGQALFMAPRCNQCHQLPVGSDHETNKTGAGFSDANPRRHWMKVAPLLTLPERGVEPVLPVTFEDGTVRNYPRIGTGLAHAGNPKNIWEFGLLLNPTVQDMVDVTNFLFQIDTGLAPATRSHVLLDASTMASAMPEITDYLLVEANERDADLAVFGTSRYRYDRETQRFFGEDGSTRTLDDLVADVESSDAWYVFVGLPVGTARRFAVDYDGDGLVNALEPSGGVFVVDTDGDGTWDGRTPDGVAPILRPSAPRPLWLTKRVGRINFETNELAQWRITLTPEDGQTYPAKTFDSTSWAHTHSVVFRDLEPGQKYAATLDVIDLDGNVRTETFEVSPRGRGDPGTVLRSFAVQETVMAAPRATFTVDTSVHDRITGLPAGGQVVVVRALVDGVPAGSAVSPVALIQSGADDFCVEATGFGLVIPYSQAPGAVGGPFVLSPPTDAGGQTQISFTLDNLPSGARVVINVEAIALPIVHDACALPVTFSSLATLAPVGWAMPDTHAHLRSAVVDIP